MRPRGGVADHPVFYSEQFVCHWRFEATVPDTGTHQGSLGLRGRGDRSTHEEHVRLTVMAVLSVTVIEGAPRSRKANKIFQRVPHRTAVRPKYVAENSRQRSRGNDILCAEELV